MQFVEINTDSNRDELTHGPRFPFKWVDSPREVPRRRYSIKNFRRLSGDTVRQLPYLDGPEASLVIFKRGGGLTIGVRPRSAGFR